MISVYVKAWELLASGLKSDVLGGILKPAQCYYVWDLEDVRLFSCCLIVTV